MGRGEEYERGPLVGRGPNISDLVTFKDFRAFMAKRGYGLDELVALFRGQLDEPRATLAAILKPFAPTDGTVIPYRSLLRFYLQELQGLQTVTDSRKRQVSPLGIVGESRTKRTG